VESRNFDFAAECIPAGDVGGDFCDMFRTADSRTAFVLGDVSGKGISAALLMALIHGAIQSMSWTRSARDHENATASLNTLLCRKTATERFSTLFWGYFDPRTSVLRYINAGHLPPLLVRTGEFGNTSDSAVSQWLNAVEAIGAAGVHIYTLAKAPSREGLRPVGTRRLREIAERVRRVGIPADVFAGPGRKV
jgi:hypothetical protein